MLKAGKIRGAALMISSAMLIAIAFDANAAGDDGSHPLKGDYSEYSGLPGDSDLPTKKDAKVTIHITGNLAKDLFQHLGPSVEKADYCSIEGDTYRSRRDLVCVLRHKAEAECWLGLDPATGKTFGGVVC